MKKLYLLFKTAVFLFVYYVMETAFKVVEYAEATASMNQMTNGNYYIALDMLRNLKNSNIIIYCIIFALLFSVDIINFFTKME